jgi:hypothetical protein
VLWAVAEGTTAVGILMAVVFIRTRSLTRIVIAHWLSNAASFAVLHQPSRLGPEVFREMRSTVRSEGQSALAR